MNIYNVCETSVFILEYHLRSSCSNKFCPNKNQESLEANTIPHITAQDELEFQFRVKDWIQESWVSPCKLPIEQPIPGEEYVFWENNSSKQLQPYCSGNRLYENRQFKKLPCILPINVAGMEENTFPSIINISQNQNYQIIGKTFYSEDTNHYTAGYLDKTDKWMFYDGKSKLPCILPI